MVCGERGRWGGGATEKERGREGGWGGGGRERGRADHGDRGKRVVLGIFDGVLQYLVILVHSHHPLGEKEKRKRKEKRKEKRKSKEDTILSSFSTPITRSEQKNKKKKTKC